MNFKCVVCDGSGKRFKGDQHPCNHCKGEGKTHLPFQPNEGAKK